MKYIAYTEMNFEDVDKLIAKRDALQEERKKFPERYPKKLLDQDGKHIVFTTSIPYGKGFMLYEGNEEQLVNLAIHWMPELKLKYVPIFTGAGEAYRKLKK